MEINYIKRKDLDVKKYDFCIENSIQSRIYAFSWYLDIVAHKWDVLVLDDYKAVMPVPWKRKYGIKYVAQPPYCQQLGVFSLEEFNQELLFVNQLKRKFKKINYNFNTKNRLSDLDCRVNYILKLDKDHTTLFKSFSKGRKHAVKKAIKNNLSISNVSLKELIRIQEENYNYKGFEKNVLLKLVKKLIQQDKGFLRGIYKNEELLGGAFFTKTNHRITYLFSTFTKSGRDLQAASFLIDNSIKENENSQIILDFEGGNIPSIATFFKSFGTEKEVFFQLNQKLKLF